jgi:polysaccharide chain length determinant protein (PEP-CTERM system associated)
VTASAPSPRRRRKSDRPLQRDLLAYLEVPLRRPWHVIVPMVLATAAAVAAALMLPKKYQSHTLILVESEKMPDSFVTRVATDSSERRLTTIRQEIMSRTRLEKIIRELDPYPGAGGSFTGTLEARREAIDIGVRGNDAFSIEFTHRDPDKAMQVTNRLATLFIEEAGRSRQQQVEEASSFIQSQLDEARKELEVKEEAVRRFKEGHLGTLPEQTGANLATLQRLQLEQQSIAESLRSAMERESTLVGALAGQVPAGMVAASTAPNDPARELGQLQSQLALLRGRYTDEHPDVKAMVARIARLEKQVQLGAEGGPVDAASLGLRTQLEQVRTEVRALQAKRDDVERRIGSFQARVELAPRTEQGLGTLTRDYQKLNENYLALLNKKLDAQMAEKLEKRWKGERFRILDPAYLPESPVFPNRTKFLLAGLMAGLVLGLACAFGVDFLDDSFKSPQDLEAHVTYPVLSVIPSVSGRRQRQPARSQKAGRRPPAADREKPPNVSYLDSGTRRRRR